MSRLSGFITRYRQPAVSCAVGSKNPKTLHSSEAVALNRASGTAEQEVKEHLTTHNLSLLGSMPSARTGRCVMLCLRQCRAEAEDT